MKYLTLDQCEGIISQFLSEQNWNATLDIELSNGHADNNCINDNDYIL